ncbi:hypothetical protein KCU62_g291, partial [Aureobasidium sp. EXF-3399]
MMPTITPLAIFSLAQSPMNHQSHNARQHFQRSLRKSPMNMYFRNRQHSRRQTFIISRHHRRQSFSTLQHHRPSTMALSKNHWPQNTILQCLLAPFGADLEHVEGPSNADLGHLPAPLRRDLCHLQGPSTTGYEHVQARCGHLPSKCLEFPFTFHPSDTRLLPFKLQFSL